VVFFISSIFVLKDDIYSMTVFMTSNCYRLGHAGV